MSRVTPLGDMAAARHALVLDDVEATGEDICAAVQWIEQDENRAQAMASIQHFLRACDSVSLLFSANAVPPPLETAEPRLWNWRYWAPLAACLVLALATFATMTMLWAPDPQRFAEAPLRLSTAVGEVRTFAFEDRPRITLGGNSTATMRVEGDTRFVTLASGQALVDGSLAASVPIVIDTGAGILVTRGGQIDIARSATRTVITQLRGRGVLRAKAALHSDVKLTEGMQVAQLVNGRLSPIRMVDPMDVASWQSGKLRFVEQPLEAVVDDLNRYSVAPIIIQTPQLGQKLVTGLVRTNRIPEWLRGLAVSLEIEVQFTPSGPILLRERRRPELIARADRDRSEKNFAQRIPRSLPSSV